MTRSFKRGIEAALDHSEAKRRLVRRLESSIAHAQDLHRLIDHDRARLTAIEDPLAR